MSMRKHLTLLGDIGVSEERGVIVSAFPTE